MGGDKLALRLKLQDGHGLVQLGETFVSRRIGIGIFRIKRRRRFVFFGVGHQGQEIDAVAVLDGVGHIVAQGDADHIGGQGKVSRAGADPGDVVIAPLNVYLRQGHEKVHDFLRLFPPVVNVA